MKLKVRWVFVKKLSKRRYVSYTARLAPSVPESNIMTGVSTSDDESWYGDEGLIDVYDDYQVFR